MPLGKDFKYIPKGAKDYELIVKWYLSLFFQIDMGNTLIPKIIFAERCYPCLKKIW